MASRDRAGRSSVRRFVFLAAFIVLAAVAYSAGWFYVAGQIDTRAQATLASLNERGVEAICTNRRIKGYPFRIGIYCDDVAFADAAEGVSFSAGDFRSAGQIYNPLFLIGELDGPARLTLPNGFPPLALDWENLRASVRLAMPLPERLSVEGRNVRAGAAREGPAQLVLEAEHAEAHMRPNGSNLDVAARLSGFTIDPALTEGRPIPPLSGDADLSIDSGVALVKDGSVDIRGQSATIRKLTISSGTDAAVTLEGPVAVGRDGLIDADLSVAIRNPEALSKILVEALPELADEIRTAFAGIVALGGGDQGQTPPLPVRIAKGKISVGFLTVGQLPPL